MPNNYNAIAGSYDFLSRLVFQRSLINAQVFLLKFIPSNSKVLIVGGGTGWVLEELEKLPLKDIQITYVEKSDKMIGLSKKRSLRKFKIDFINQGIEEFTTEQKFDVVFTAFLFDNFLRDKIEIVFGKLNQLLKPGSLWLYADFINEKSGKLWKKLLLKTMYLFFRLTCNIETRQLINMDDFFTSGYKRINQSFYHSDFIKAVAYLKEG